MALPDTYKQVEYIKSSGTQYINTGFSPSNKTKVVCKLSSDGIMYGCGVNGQYQALSLMNYNQYYTGRFKTTSSSNQTIQSTVPVGGVHTFENSQVDGFYIDGTLIGTYTQYTFTESRPMYLFAWNGTGSTPPAYGSGLIYYLKIYENGTLVRDYAPVIRKSDSKPGMYDLVNNVFYTNQGTGEFEYPKESGKITHIYLGTNLIRPSTSSTFEYSYDFRNKSWTQVQNDGWTLIQGTSWTTINSNGINFPTRGQGASNKVRISYPIVLTGAKKITMEMTYYGAASDWGNSFDYTTRSSSNFDDWGTSMAWSTTTASGYMGRWSGSSRNLSLRYNNSPVTGTYTSTATFDLTTKAMTFQRNGLSQLTGTIPDGDISIIRSMNILAVNGGHDVGTVQLRTIYIKVEY